MPLNFSRLMDVLASQQVWQYETIVDRRCSDVAAASYTALQRPDDFPPIASAVVAGDRVTLAVDPNVPEIAAVIRGVIHAFSETDAEGVDVVLWDEVDDETLAAVKAEMPPTSRVVRHASSDRRSLSYLAADESAEPIYLNRLLVDADFVLPIMAGRPLTKSRPRDLTGVYPWLADSAARVRYRDSPVTKVTENAKMAAETNWLLGVQIMLCVSPSSDGAVSTINAGTIEAVGERLRADSQQEESDAEDEGEEDFPPPASLVIASLDGGQQQQTWANLARAATAAAEHVLPGGTIVIWTEINVAPGATMSLGSGEETGDESDEERAEEDERMAAESVLSGDDQEFPRWDSFVEVAGILERIAAEYRLLIHANLDETTIESLGLGCVTDGADLMRLSRSFDSCGVLRAAQFA